LKKNIILFLFSIIPFIVFAQTESSNAVMGIENGVVFGYNLGSVSPGGLGSGNFVSLNLTVSKNVETSFTYINGDGVSGNFPSYNLLGISYLFNSKLGLNISVGQKTVPAIVAVAGTGIYYSIFEKVFDNTINTDFKFKLNYLYDFTSGVNAGVLCFSLSASIGI